MGVKLDQLSRETTSLIIFERKILRKIYGPLYNRETERFERRHNNEIQELFERPKYILSYMK